MKHENETSKLAENFLTDFFSKSAASKVSAYSSKHSMSRTLSEQRSIYLEQTEEAISRLGECVSIYQMQTAIRKLPIEVQYFLSERAIVLSVTSQYDDRLTLDDDELSLALPQRIVQLLRRLWELHLHHLNQDGIELDTHLSHIVHGHL